MLNFQVISIFPEFVQQLGDLGLMRRAIKEGAVSLSAINLRDYAVNNHGQVDDTPYGGGAGMVMMVEPALNAVREAKAKDPSAKVVLFSPRGKTLSQKRAVSLLEAQRQKESGFILLCSRYEGVDERIVSSVVDEEVSLGDFILMGGELPAMVFIETLTRLLPSVLGNPESVAEESFSGDFLEHPHYTKPQVYEGMEVPEVLCSGNHALVAEWRKDRQRCDTLARRPDLLQGRELSAKLSLALLHHPVVDKQGDIITSSLTNLDIHDIARSCKTYGVDRFYISHPIGMMRRLAQKVCDHWQEGYGLHYNPNRGEALEKISLAVDLDDIIVNMESRHKMLPKIVVTSAHVAANTVTFKQLRGMLNVDTEPYVILLGTGWGLASEVMERADYRLEPIVGPTPYNHLSVRAAAAIILDRLLAPLS